MASDQELAGLPADVREAWRKTRSLRDAGRGISGSRWLRGKRRGILRA